MRLQTLCKLAGVFAVCLAMGATASAQYGGGGGSMGGTGTGNTPQYGYGSGKAIGIGVGAAAAAGVGIALLIHHHHKMTRSEASLIGCAQSGPNGISLKNETDGTTYMILSGGTHVQPGRRVEVKGVVTDDSSGTHAFRVRNVVNDYGACGQTAASTQGPEANRSEAAAQ